MTLTISPAALKAEIDAGATVDLIDVRTPAEFTGVHAQGASCVDAPPASPRTSRRGAPSTPQDPRH